MIGLIAHSNKPDAPKVVRALVNALEARGARYLLESQTAGLAGLSSPHSERDLAARCRVLAVMGGDGTILRLVHNLGPNLRPVFGINIGSLGFLTCTGSRDIERAAESLARKDYVLSPRTLLRGELVAGGSRRKFYALNDIVISRGERSQLVKVSVRLDGGPFTEYNADGLIVATPTGSTAYALSAGGPILVPGCGSHVITPICPHVLTNRSTVVSERAIIEARVGRGGQQVFVTVDGQDRAAMGAGDSLRISRSRRILPLAMLPDRPFPEVLRQKLKWSGSNV